MSNKSPKSGANTEPTDLPQMTPPMSGDMSKWVMTAISDMKETVGNLNGTLTGMQGQLTRLETTVGDIKKDVHGHGHWVFALRLFGYAVIGVVSWSLVNVIWPLLKPKLGFGN